MTAFEKKCSDSSAHPREFTIPDSGRPTIVPASSAQPPNRQSTPNLKRSRTCVSQYLPFDSQSSLARIHPSRGVPTKNTAGSKAT
eukprot:scaffold475_cov279-Pinguiococcus_pyrenoidosus.AAC.3